MAKIPKNLEDKAMFAGVKEVETFETMFFAEEEEQKPKAKAKPKPKNKEQEDIRTAFLTKDLQEKLGKLLLELKLDLYKEGVVDYQIKVKRDGQQIILSPEAAKKKLK